MDGEGEDEPLFHALGELIYFCVDELLQTGKGGNPVKAFFYLSSSEP